MNTKLIRDINMETRSKEILENEEVDFSPNLRPEEVSRLVGMVHEQLKKEGREADVDAASELIGLYTEDIPGLEMPLERDKALRVVLDAYKESL